MPSAATPKSWVGQSIERVEDAALREFLVGLGLLLVLFFRPRGLMPEPLPRLTNQPSS